MSTLRSCLSAIAAASLASAPAVVAQTRPATDATAPAKADETILLSEFTVKEGSEQGYVASESITGTRVATQIKDLPFSVSVIMKGKLSGPR